MLSAPQLEKLFTMLRRRFVISSGSEITVEANPEDMDLAKAKVLHDLGVNRVSLGIQTFNDKHLKYLGRVHDSFKALTAFNDLRRAGCKNLSVDLMYSFPEQTATEIKEDIQIMLGLRSEHVSLYTLTVEENSRFFVQRIKEQDTHVQGDHYDLVVTSLDAAGIRQYEISNFSRPGFESKHNTHYWKSGNYIGLGMSAHSHRDGRRSWNVSRLADYLNKIKAGESAEEGFEVLPPEKRLTEALAFGLRMNEGVDLLELETQFGVSFSMETKETIERFVRNRFLAWDNERLVASLAGRRILDTLSVELI